MWIVLGSFNDVGALWAYEGLKARGLEPLEFVSSESLAYSLFWEHRVGRSGSTYTAFRLADGRCFTSKEIRGVLNRLVHLPTDHFAVAQPGERAYAGQELTAFVLSWLTSLGPNVLNLPSPQGLFGRWRRPLEWLQLASRAGLSTRDYPDIASEISGEEPDRFLRGSRSNRMALVLDDTVYGPDLPARVRSGAIRLGRLSETRLLGVSFHPGSEKDWVFESATPLPDLRPGGNIFLDGLMEALTQER